MGSTHSRTLFEELKEVFTPRSRVESLCDFDVYEPYNEPLLKKSRRRIIKDAS